MHYLAFLFIGFCLGAVAGLKLAEVLLAELKRDIKRLEQRLNRPAPGPGQLRVIASDGEVLEDFA